jgi:hypothetical protein
VITCAVLELEIAHFGAALRHLIHVETMPQGLHNDPPRLRTELQRAIDKVERETAAEVIVLGYGLCSRGTEGVRTTRCRLVMPRAHDCITLLLGSKEKYEECVRRCPGTYWYSPGWNKHHLPPGPERYEHLHQEYCEKYGADEADYLMQMERHWCTAYCQAVYVDLGVGATEQDLQYTRGCAEWLNWSFARERGDPGLLTALLEGRWDDERFVTVGPGETFRMTGDERILEATGTPPAAEKSE